MAWIEVVRCRHTASGWTTCHDGACFLFYYIQNILYIFVKVWSLAPPLGLKVTAASKCGNTLLCKTNKKPMILQIQYIYGNMFNLKCVSPKIRRVGFFLHIIHCQNVAVILLAYLCIESGIYMHPSCLHRSFQVVWFPLKTCMLNIQSLIVQFSLISKKALYCCFEMLYKGASNCYL